MLNCTLYLTPCHKEMRIAKLNTEQLNALIDVDRKQKSLNGDKNIQRRHFSTVHKLFSDNALSVLLMGQTAFYQIRF